MWPLVRPHVWRLVFAAALVAFVGIAVAVGPVFTKYVIDTAIPGKDIGLALAVMAVFLVVQFIRMALWYIAQWRILWMREDVVFRMRSQSFQHLQRLCLRFHNRFPSGFLYERVFGRSINAIGIFLATIFSSFTVYVSGLLFSLMFCLYYSPAMTVVILIGAVGYVITAAVHVGGAYAIFHWEMSLGTLVAFIAYQAMFTSMMSTLTAIYGQLGAARAGFDQLFTVLDTQSTVRDLPGAAMPEQVEGRLEFRNVTFGYSQKPVLKEMSLSIQPGQTVALVGRSGAGKTTIANLLMRFYDPNCGAILLDGRDIRELPIRQYRALYGVVLQDPFLFDDTIAANLRCARPNATEDDLLDALKKTCALDFTLEFPKKLNHPVGEGGAQLSGGQRHRRRRHVRAARGSQWPLPPAILHRIVVQLKGSENRRGWVYVR